MTLYLPQDIFWYIFFLCVLLLISVASVICLLPRMHCAQYHILSSMLSPRPPERSHKWTKTHILKRDSSLKSLSCIKVLKKNMASHKTLDDVWGQIYFIKWKLQPDVICWLFFPKWKKIRNSHASSYFFFNVNVIYVAARHQSTITVNVVNQLGPFSAWTF